MSDPNLTTHLDCLLGARNPRFDALSDVTGTGFYNKITGLGTARDKTEYTQFSTIFRPLDTQTLAALYHGHDLSARIVDVVPDEGLRLPYHVEVEGDSKAEALIADEFERLEVREHLLQGWTFGRCFGGAATIVGARDGISASKPLNWDRLREPIAWLKTVDRRYLWPNTWYVGGPKNGQVETYWLSDISPGHSDCFVIHESRLILWPGARTAQQERDQNNSWDLSVLDRCWNTLKSFETVYRGIELLVTEGPQAVYKVRGLIEKLAAGEEDKIRSRFELIDMFRSALRAVIIDADGSESFERQQVTYSGTPEILGQMQMRLAATAQIPMIVLFGQAPGGLGVTGENDLRWFFYRIASEQLNRLAPRIKVLAKAVLRSNGLSTDKAIKVSFDELWVPSEKERSESRFYQAQTDEKYIENNVLTPEEVCLSRFKDKGTWSPDWSAVSLDTRKKMLKEVLDQLENGGPGEGQETPQKIGEPLNAEKPEQQQQQQQQPPNATENHSVDDGEGRAEDNKESNRERDKAS